MFDVECAFFANIVGLNSFIFVARTLSFILMSWEVWLSLWDTTKLPVLKELLIAQTSVASNVQKLLRDTKSFLSGIASK